MAIIKIYHSNTISSKLHLLLKVNASVAQYKQWDSHIIAVYIRDVDAIPQWLYFLKISHPYIAIYLYNFQQWNPPHPPIRFSIFVKLHPLYMYPRTLYIRTHTDTHRRDVTVRRGACMAEWLFRFYDSRINYFASHMATGCFFGSLQTHTHTHTHL